MGEFRLLVELHQEGCVQQACFMEGSMCDFHLQLLFTSMYFRESQKGVKMRCSMSGKKEYAVLCKRRVQKKANFLLLVDKRLTPPPFPPRKN